MRTGSTGDCTNFAKVSEILNENLFGRIPNASSSRIVTKERSRTALAFDPRMTNFV